MDGEVDEPVQKPPPAAPLKPRGPAIDADPPPPKPPEEKEKGIPWLQVVAAVIVGGLAGVIVLGLIGNHTPKEQVAVSPKTSKAVKGLGTAEKVDSLMAIGFSGSTHLPAVAKTQGGVLVGAGNWQPGSPIASAIHHVNRGVEGAIPPLVIGDQEGGPFRAYPDLPPTTAEFDIGRAGDPAAAEEWAKQTGTALRKAGFDLNLFPVADISGPYGPLAGRGFSEDAAVAAQLTAAAIRGCEAARIACAPGHFPGAGSESQDTADGPATVGLSADALAARDLLPFGAAIKAGAPAILVSNAFFAAYDPVTPASLSPVVIGDQLRKQLDFKGVVITDDLSEGAIRGGQGAADAAVQAIASGADLLVISDPTDAAAARSALLKAVKKNQIPRARLDAAVSRVLELKRRQGLLE